MSRQPAMTVVSWIVVAALVFLLLIYLLQDRLLYHPVRSSLQDPPVAGLRPWPSAGDFRGWVAEPADGAARTAVLFHGNGGHAAERTYYAQVLGALGFRVILAEYPGYGPRAGATGEASLVADAAETLVRAHRQYGAPLLVIGESLGAGVAAAAAPRQPAAVAGLLLITPWDRLVHVASHHYPWLPVRTIQRLGGVRDQTGLPGRAGSRAVAGVLGEDHAKAEGAERMAVVRALRSMTAVAVEQHRGAPCAARRFGDPAAEVVARGPRSEARARLHLQARPDRVVEKPVLQQIDQQQEDDRRADDPERGRHRPRSAHAAARRRSRFAVITARSPAPRIE